jgi:DNA polymerase (family 10)
MLNQEIARIFNEMANYLELKNDNIFRVRAYRRAALNVEGLTHSLGEMSEEELLELPGIGKDLAAKIAEYIKTGKVAAHEELRQEIPPVVLEI